MTSLSRRSSASGRIGGTLVAAAALLLLAALLTLAEGAAAQTAEPSEITVYHSLDGVDRRGTVPPGCTTPGAPAGTVTIDFEPLASGTSLENLYEGVTFSGVGDNQILALVAGDGEFIGNSEPTVAAVFDSLNQPSTSEDFFADFDPPVNNLRFTVVGDNAVGSAQLTVFFGTAESVIMTIPTDAIYNSIHVMDLSAYADVTRIEITSIVDPGGIGYDDFNFTTGETEPNCVLGGGTDEVLKLWIFGGSENSLEGQTVCAQDFIDIPGEGAGNIIGGTGQEICGAALNFAITGPGRFKGALRADTYEGDDGIDTLVFGSACPLANEGEGPECDFPPNLKLLSMNFRTGGSTPSNLARHLVDLIIDTSSWTEGDETEISVGGQGGGAKLQLLTIESETVASLPVPEPTQLVQLLSGLFGLAGLNRLRRKH